MNTTDQFAKVSKLEVMVAGWLKPLPHLPKKFQKWLAENAWWLALIGLVVSIIAIVSLVGLVLTVMTFLSGTVGFYTAAVGQLYTGFSIITTVISLLFSAISIALIAFAIKPLKAQLKRGWTLMFSALLVNIAAAVVDMVLDFNVFMLVPSLIAIAVGAGIGAYLLFEIRQNFGSKAVIRPAPAVANPVKE